mmetsp:Transcript_26061/g.41941  ORF Transcript_26061/g.41941 Transcript_26061/m.41941 type:complete len:102 (-) Transcript_26061:142-447(-)
MKARMELTVNIIAKIVSSDACTEPTEHTVAFIDTWIAARYPVDCPSSSNRCFSPPVLTHYSTRAMWEGVRIVADEVPTLSNRSFRLPNHSAISLLFLPLTS